jgi:hypothetical protein
MWVHPTAKRSHVIIESTWQKIVREVGKPLYEEVGASLLPTIGRQNLIEFYTNEPRLKSRPVFVIADQGIPSASVSSGPSGLAMRHFQGTQNCDGLGHLFVWFAFATAQTEVTQSGVLRRRDIELLSIWRPANLGLEPRSGQDISFPGHNMRDQ